MPTGVAIHTNIANPIVIKHFQITVFSAECLPCSSTTNIPIHLYHIDTHTIPVQNLSKKNAKNKNNYSLHKSYAHDFIIAASSHHIRKWKKKQKQNTEMCVLKTIQYFNCNLKCN